jgi:hypothetical protein
MDCSPAIRVAVAGAENKKSNQTGYSMSKTKGGNGCDLAAKSDEQLLGRVAASRKKVQMSGIFAVRYARVGARARRHRRWRRVR